MEPIILAELKAELIRDKIEAADQITSIYNNAPFAAQLADTNLKVAFGAKDSDIESLYLSNAD